MYTVLDKDTIEMEIIPHIPRTKRGFPPTVPLVEIVNAILYKLKTGVNELIYDNYNTVAIAFSKSEKLKDAFCHIAVYSKHINFGFNRGSELSKSNVKLEGKGKLIRHITVKKIE